MLAEQVHLPRKCPTVAQSVATISFSESRRAIKKDDGLLSCHVNLFARYCRRHIPFHDIIIPFDFL